jgi:ATP-binding cassette, subfamily C, bacteriocin exporter
MQKISTLKKTFVLQHGQSDCGVACLLSLIKYYGGDASLENLREQSGTSIQGTTLLGLYQSSVKFGFDAEGLEAEGVHNLAELNEPVILHVLIDSRLQHYFVFYGFAKSGLAVIGDPAKGIIEISKDELEKAWQSKALLKLTPNKNFVKRSDENSKKKAWIIDLIKEDVNILVVGLFLGIIISVLGLSTAIFSQKLIDNILPSGNQQKLILSLVLVTVLLLARSGLASLRGFFLIRQGMDFNNRIIGKFYSSLLRLPKSFFDTRKTGDLIARMNDTRRIQTTISIISGNIIIDLLLVIVSTVFVFVYSATLGFVVIGSIPVYMGIVYFFNDKIIRSQKEVMSSYGFTESHYVDTIQGIATVKSSNSENFFETVNKQVYGFFQNKIFDLGKLNIRFGLLSEVTGVIFMILVFGVSSWMVLDKTLQLGEMVALLSMAGSIMPSINRLVAANFQIQEARVAFDRMFEFTSVLPEQSEEKDLSVVSLKTVEQVLIKNISFRFAGRKQILKNISLELNKGEMIALLGESGGGKSTFTQLLQKFYLPETGVVEVNGINLSNVNTSMWRDSIGVVPQDIKIFNGNLLYNITLSDQPKDFEAAIKFCQGLGFEQYFKSFPQVYLTLLGEEGINISGGQRQLVALARALFRNPQLLILDEATAAMDKNTENFVLQLLLKLKSEMAVLLVTHRIKSARMADRIYILEEGKISASGTPTTLLNTDNFYSESVRELTVI